MKTQQHTSEMRTETITTEKNLTGTIIKSEILQKIIWPNLDILDKSCLQN